MIRSFLAGLATGGVAGAAALIAASLLAPLPVPRDVARAVPGAETPRAEIPARATQPPPARVLARLPAPPEVVVTRLRSQVAETRAAAPAAREASAAVPAAPDGGRAPMPDAAAAVTGEAATTIGTRLALPIPAPRLTGRIDPSAVAAGSERAGLPTAGLASAAPLVAATEDRDPSPVERDAAHTAAAVGGEATPRAAAAKTARAGPERPRRPTGPKAAAAVGQVAGRGAQTAPRGRLAQVPDTASPAAAAPPSPSGSGTARSDAPAIAARPAALHEHDPSDPRPRPRPEEVREGRTIAMRDATVPVASRGSAPATARAVPVAPERLAPRAASVGPTVGRSLSAPSEQVGDGGAAGADAAGTRAPRVVAGAPAGVAAAPARAAPAQDTAAQPSGDAVPTSGLILPRVTTAPGPVPQARAPQRDWAGGARHALAPDLAGPLARMRPTEAERPSSDAPAERPTAPLPPARLAEAVVSPQVVPGFVPGQGGAVVPAVLRTGFDVRLPPLPSRATAGVPGVATGRLPVVRTRSAVRMVDRFPSRFPLHSERASEAQAPQEGAAPPTPLARNAQPFEGSAGRPMLAVVVLADGDASDPAPRADLGFPVAVALDPARDGAAARGAALAAAGHEVILRGATLPAGGEARDAEVALAARLGALPQSLGLMEDAPGALAESGAAGRQVLAILAAEGYGTLLWERDLGLRRGMAAPGPSARVVGDLRDVSGAGEAGRALDRAAFEAGLRGAAVVVLPDTPEMLQLLRGWAASPRASRVALAPLSAVMSAAPARDGM